MSRVTTIIPNREETERKYKQIKRWVQESFKDVMIRQSTSPKVIDKLIVMVKEQQAAKKELD